MPCTWVCSNATSAALPLIPTCICQGPTQARNAPAYSSRIRKYHACPRRRLTQPRFDRAGPAGPMHKVTTIYHHQRRRYSTLRFGHVHRRCGCTTKEKTKADSTLHTRVVRSYGQCTTISRIPHHKVQILDTSTASRNKRGSAAVSLWSQPLAGIQSNIRPEIGPWRTPWLTITLRNRQASARSALRGFYGRECDFEKGS